MDECVHGLGDIAWCVICNGKAAAEEAAEAARKAAAKVPFWLFKKEAPRKGALIRDSRPGADRRVYQPEYASRIRDRARQDWD